jgi:VWFA-related protein
MRYVVATLCWFAACASVSVAQQLPPMPPPPPGWQAPATATAPVQSSVNVVPIRVIVRDTSGKVVTNLQRENFVVTQDGKPQTVANFAVMSGGVNAQPSQTEQIAPSSAGGAEASAPAPPPNHEIHLVVLLFDDLQLDMPSLSRAKVAADKFIDASQSPDTRFAILTSSGESQTEFTPDVAELHKAIAGLAMRQMGALSVVKPGQCPPMSFYEAELIAVENDAAAEGTAEAQTIDCAHLDPRAGQQADSIALEMAQQVVMAGSTAAQSTLRRLADVITRLAPLPGQRSIVLISPGFLTYTFEQNISDMLNRASNASITINTLDARGLYTSEPIGDITQDVPAFSSVHMDGSENAYHAAEFMQMDFIMRDLAAGTGGVAFINNNDLYAGFVKTAAKPEMTYLLAYTPVNLKSDGKFHVIKVKLTGPGTEHYKVQARRGFIAPKKKLK